MKKQNAAQLGHEYDAPSAGEMLTNHFTARAQELISLIKILSESDTYDVEELRRCRTAVRRLRCGLNTCSEGIAPDVGKQLSHTLKNFVEPLGIVRDFDVLYALISATLQSWDLRDDDAGSEILRQLANDGQDASDLLANHFQSQAVQQFQADLQDFAHDIPIVSKLAKQDARRYFLRISRRSWHKLEADVAGLKKNYTDKQLHQLRVKVKSTRYTFQAATVTATASSREGAVDGKTDAARHARRLGKLQDVLGAHQDCFVAIAWLRTSIARSTDPKSAALARQVIVDLQHQMEGHRATWPKFWKNAKTKSTTKWLNDK